MSLPLELQDGELNAFFKVINGSLTIGRHEELFQWLREDVQRYLPHEIMIAAWGDFALGILHLDIISKLPGLRTTEVDKHELTPFLLRLFHLWEDSNGGPITLSFEAFDLCNQSGESVERLSHSIADGRCALAQGIKDERGRHDCLYVLLGHFGGGFSGEANQFMRLLVPFIDVALRQVSHLPVQSPDLLDTRAGRSAQLQPNDSSPEGKEDILVGSQLSEREKEIMHWVQMGKTNGEIGQILDISAFTVKNHLQRIFRKINVLNRAQAVSMLASSLPRRNS